MGILGAQQAIIVNVVWCGGVGGGISTFGSPSGENFANLFQKVLEKFECTRQLFSILSNNALANNKMVKWIEKEVPEFNHKTRLLGCVTHITNLAAKSALTTFGKNKENKEEHELPTSMVDVSFITSKPG
ncbi:uncharacterized protein VP01_1620g5 [Puccinia sorghi]|uniref:DUF659 domain-containing protein n=1 Tax=Puccinia sorghi TaxID=27349 RepID=A0A0L6VIV4_9BASI|nr:uncharacterized protein VP01_1620g5 [Puccinia sorghi]